MDTRLRLAAFEAHLQHLDHLESPAAVEPPDGTPPLLAIILRDEGRRKTVKANAEQRRKLGEQKERLLSSLTYPVLTIPVEITAEIFLHCLPEYPTHPNESIAPMLLLRICRRWRDIALGESRLWSSLKIGCAALRRVAEEEWLSRAGGPPQFHTLQPNILAQSADLMEECDFPSWEPPCRDPFSEVTPRHYFTAAFAQLTSLTLSEGFCSEQCVEILRRLPRLLHCNFEGVSEHENALNDTRPPLVHANLQSLTLHHGELDRCALFNWLDLPALRTLHLTGAVMQPDTELLVSFIRRSPLIHNLTWTPEGPGRLILHMGDHGTRDGILRVLRAMPVLKHLTLGLYTPKLAFDVIGRIRSDSLLPRLEHITFAILNFHGHMNRPLSVAPSVVLEFLTSRADAQPGVAQLREFAFTYPRDMLRHLSLALAGIGAAALQRLRDKGMVVSITTKDYGWLCPSL
ncbi:hypothetical protein C8R47DRAFT_1051352 [Mycena vitilis]|nr:hypothetical protein C8R47DRAFT_1051352 [Mycena vitilis]